MIASTVRVQALVAARGRVTKAARRLQIGHQTLRHLLAGRHKDTLGKQYPARLRKKKAKQQ